MCLNNSMCGCSGNGHGNGECTALGPFVAIDAACIPPVVNRDPMIAFSSGVTTVALATLATGAIGVPWLVGFGTAVPGVTILGNALDLSGVVTEAFVVPRTGNITAISASFSTLVGTTVFAGTVTLRAQIYRAPAGSNVYTATGAVVDLAPAITGPLTVNQIAFGSANVSVPVVTGDKLVMVFSIATTSGITAVQIVTGTASAGITIS